MNKAGLGQKCSIWHTNNNNIADKSQNKKYDDKLYSLISHTLQRQVHTHTHTIIQISGKKHNRINKKKITHTLEDNGAKNYFWLMLHAYHIQWNGKSYCSNYYMRNANDVCVCVGCASCVAFAIIVEAIQDEDVKTVNCNRKWKENRCRDWKCGKLCVYVWGRERERDRARARKWH